LPDTLLESELFGHKAGAFTDARKDKPGRFARAEGGTLFLDEVGDISPAMQSRLLRVLQEKVYEPLGGVETIKSNVRIVAATHRDLPQLVASGTFRQDLFYRINVIRLELPPLRDRREDVALLAEHLIGRFNRLQGKNVAGFSAEVLACLMAHHYPGNVRELENILEHAFVLCRGGLIELHHLPPHLRCRGEISGGASANSTTLAGMERVLMADALRRHKGNRSAAAKELGISPSTLFRKCKVLKLPLPKEDGRQTRRG
jgi:transcriptional regulator with PAS, ATPase and Fis domain